MPLEEISGNRVAIPRVQSLPDGLKRPGKGAPKGDTRKTHLNGDIYHQTASYTKIAILVARFVYQEQWKAIEERFSFLGVKASTACAIYQKAYDVEKKDDFLTILKHLNDKHKPGQKPIIERGSKDSIAIRTAFLEYSSLPQAQAARKRGFVVSDSTASRIANHYRDQPQAHVEGLDRPIKRRIAPRKPCLTDQNKKARIEASHQIIKILDAGGIIICSDETLSQPMEELTGSKDLVLHKASIIATSMLFLRKKKVIHGWNGLQAVQTTRLSDQRSRIEIRIHTIRSFRPSSA